jgi:hypothetical protein
MKLILKKVTSNVCGLSVCGSCTVHYTVKPFLRCMVGGTPAVIYSGESIFEHDDLHHFETSSHPLGQKWPSSW